VHHKNDESFYIVSGALELLNGDETLLAEVGDLVFVPRGTRHRFKNIGDTDAHVLILMTPGGPEALFVEAGDGGGGGD